MKERGLRPRDFMLAKGKKSVNGKCVLLCTLEETTGRKITILTASHPAAVFLSTCISLKTKVTNIYTTVRAYLHSNCELEQY